RYRKSTEGEAKAEGNDKGTFSRWCYEHRGLFTLSAALWEIPLEEKKKDEKKEDKDKDKKDEKAGAGGEEKPAAAEGEKKPEEPKAEEKPQEGEKKEGKDEKKKDKKDDEPKPSDDAKRLKWIDAAGADEAW